MAREPAHRHSDTPALRRERLRLPICVVAPALLVALQAANIASTYPTGADRTAAA
jgi:putative exporter of polyketide antibiotics